MPLGNSVKKQPFKKIFPQLCKTSVILLIFSHKWKKRVTERNKRLNLWILFNNRGTQPAYDFCWFNHWKWLVPYPMRGSWIFCQTERYRDCFLQPNVLIKLSKITVPSPKLVKTSRVKFDLPKSLQNDFQFRTTYCQRIYVSPVIEKLETWNLDNRVNLIQRVL